MPEENENIMQMMAFGASFFATALESVKENGHFQACCIQALIDALKEHGALNESVDMAVSYNGRVIRNENAADYCE